ncbi:hypothetical protein DRQ32_06175 [bacterium]|nr:MAG: hypothetical protein DRQ32_06175 [bacterium]
MSDARLREFATRYATAWSTQDPQRFAAFYTEDGRLQINDGDSSIGREAIAATAGVFMAAFPDMIVDLVSVAFDGDGDVDGDGDGDGDGDVDGNTATFHWHWTGTNNGPGGTGLQVDMTGYEVWTFGPDGLIKESKGHLDQAEYDRQMGVVGES